MTINEIVEKAISVGIENDPRGVEIINKDLPENGRLPNESEHAEKNCSNSEMSPRPYYDTRVLCGPGNLEIKDVMVGIDIGVGEILLAAHLKEKGQNIDAVISHHPEGAGLSQLYMVMGMQSDILNKFGVPINVAEDFMEKRIKSAERDLMGVNHNRTVDAAKLLNIPLACIHTPADNMVTSYLQSMLDRRKPYWLSNVIDILLELPEYREARLMDAGPKIFLGSGKRKAGKIFVDMTGGSVNSEHIFEKLTVGGVNTIITMHFREEYLEEVKKERLNLIIAGHMASDSLGLNLLFDSILEKGINLIECSGFKRICRNDS